MNDLVAFITARLDEDEQAALSAEHAHPPVGWLITYHAEAMHSIRHDPARVLREVEADRRIIERYEQMKADGESHWFLIYDVIKLRALPHADHPDYDESWRP